MVGIAWRAASATKTPNASPGRGGVAKWTRLTPFDLVMWRDGQTTVGAYVELQHRAETEREIKKAMRKIQQRKAERAKLLRQARAKGD